MCVYLRTKFQVLPQNKPRKSLLRLIEKKRVTREEKTQKQRKFWVRPIFKDKKLKGEFHTLIQDLKLFGSEYFLKQFRMTLTKAAELLSWVAPKIKKSSVRREPIGPERRLCVTLRDLVSGDAHVTIAASYMRSPTSIDRII